MNPVSRMVDSHTPHQFAMKVYVDTWIYVTEKFGNMGYIEVYRGILRYETGIYPTIPSFIYLQSPLLAVISDSRRVLFAAAHRQK